MRAREKGFSVMTAATLKDHLKGVVDAVKARLSRKDKAYEPAVPTLIVETHTGEGYSAPTRNYHVNERVADMPYSSYNFCDGRLRKGYLNDGDAPERVANLYIALKAVKGVTQVELGLYEVHINVGKAFQWEHVEPAIVDVLRQYLGWFGDVKVTYIETHHRPRADRDIFRL